MDVDLYDEPLGEDSNGEPVYLKDTWPTENEVAQTIEDDLEDPRMVESKAM